MKFDIYVAENKYYSHESSEEMWTSFEREKKNINKITELRQDIYNMKIPSSSFCSYI